MQRMLFLWLCLMAAANTEAAIYQWTDSTGAVQFSDQRPQVSVEVIERQDIEARSKSPPVTPSRHRNIARVKTRTSHPHKPKVRAATHEDSAREKRKQRCDKYQHRIDVTQSKMRAGYSARRGIALAERLRADHDVYYHECR